MTVENADTQGVTQQAIIIEGKNLWIIEKVGNVKNY
jgi:hypothetical protein